MRPLRYGLQDVQCMQDLQFDSQQLYVKNATPNTYKRQSVKLITRFGQPESDHVCKNLINSSMYSHLQNTAPLMAARVR